MNTFYNIQIICTWKLEYIQYILHRTNLEKYNIIVLVLHVPGY